MPAFSIYCNIFLVAEYIIMSLSQSIKRVKILRRNDDIGGERNRRRRRRCDCVFECLLDLLEDALDDNRRRRRRNCWDWNDDDVF